LPSSDVVSDLAVILTSLWYVVYPLLAVILGFVAKQTGVLRYSAGLAHIVPFLKVEFRAPEKYVLHGVIGEPTIGTLNVTISNMARWRFLASNAHNVQLQLLLVNTVSGGKQRYSPIIWDLTTKETRILEMLVGQECPVRLLTYYVGSKSVHVMNVVQTLIESGIYRLELEAMCSEYKRPLRKKYVHPCKGSRIINVPEELVGALI